MIDSQVQSLPNKGLKLRSEFTMKKSEKIFHYISPRQTQKIYFYNSYKKDSENQSNNNGTITKY